MTSMIDVTEMMTEVESGLEFALLVSRKHTQRDAVRYLPCGIAAEQA